MNLDLIKKHVVQAAKAIKNPKFNKDGSNASDFYSADVVGHKRFAQNFGGYPRSEIAEINAQTNLENAKQLLSQLTDFSAEAGNQNAGVPDAIISMGHKSKYMQCPAEMIDYVDGQLAIRDSLRAQQAAKLAAAQATKVGKSVDVPPVKTDKTDKTDNQIVDEV